MDMIYLFANYKQLGENRYTPLGITVNTYDAQKEFINNNSGVISEPINDIFVANDKKERLIIFPNVIPCDSNAYVITGTDSKLRLYNKEAMAKYTNLLDFINISKIPTQEWIVLPEEQLDKVLIYLVRVEKNKITLDADKEIPDYLQEVLDNLSDKNNSLFEIISTIKNDFPVKYIEHKLEMAEKEQEELAKKEKATKKTEKPKKDKLATKKGKGDK